MFLQALMIAILAVSVSSCASFEASQGGGRQARVYPPEVYAHRVATSDVVLYWNCVRPEAGVLKLD